MYVRVCVCEEVLKTSKEGERAVSDSVSHRVVVSPHSSLLSEQILTSCNNEQRQVLKKEFKTMYGRDLIDDLKSGASHSERQIERAGGVGQHRSSQVLVLWLPPNTHSYPLFNARMWYVFVAPWFDR